MRKNIIILGLSSLLIYTNKNYLKRRYSNIKEFIKENSDNITD